MLFSPLAIILLASSVLASNAPPGQVVMSAPPHKPTLFDLLTVTPSVSIFFSYARETDISKLLVDDSAKSTFLVPTNRAVMALARKPHQNTSPVDNSIELTEQQLDELSKDSVLRWVSMHVIPKSPIEFADREYSTFAEGKPVTFKMTDGEDPEKPDWARAIVNEDIRLLEKKEASNGVFYILDGTIKDE